MGDGNAAFRLASNLKTAWLGSTCQGHGVSAYANQDIFNKCGAHVHIQINFKDTSNTKKVTFHVYFYYVKFYCGRSKGEKKPIWVYFGHIRLVYTQLICILKFIFKETCNTKNATLHGYFHCVKFYFDRSKGKKLHFWGIVAWHYQHTSQIS